MLSVRSKSVLIFAVFLGLFLATDRAFDAFIFSRTNHSGWDSYRWYNFEYHLRKLEDKYAKTGSARPVIFTGSSIAAYSVFVPAIEQSLYEKTGQYTPVELVSHAAMLPEDAYHYMKRIRSLNPKLIVYITNPADLDIERYVPYWEAGPSYDRQSHIDYLKIRIPPDLYYPAAFAADRFKHLSIQELSSLLFRAPFSGVRWSGYWYDAFQFSGSVRANRMKSYLYYQGVYVPEGLWKNGQTASHFRFQVKSLHKSGLYFEIPPELFHKELKISVFMANPPGAAAGTADLFENGAKNWQEREEVQNALKKARRGPLRFEESCGATDHIQDYLPEKSGWQTLVIEDALKRPDSTWYCIALSHVMIDGKRTAADETGRVVHGRGLRLPGNFGKKRPVDDYLVRRRSLEDEQILNRSADQYFKDYMEKIQPDDWRNRIELRQFNTLRLSKLLLNWNNYEPPEQSLYLERISRSSDYPFVIINNPENPAESVIYQDSVWYSGLKNHYRQIAGSGDLFFDYSQELKVTDFTDPHHLTYDASLRMSDLYAEAVVRALDAAREHE